MRGTEAFTKMASAGMQVGMVMQSVRSLFTAWSNDDLSFGEKITTSLMSIGMIIPSVISAMSTLKEIYLASSAAIKAFQMANEASNLVTEAGIALKGQEVAVSMEAEVVEGATAAASIAK
jgi:hypothetical protein